MDAKTNEEFTQHLWATVRETEAAGYDPRRFKTMLNTDGGFDVVKRILESGKPSDGFTKLWELKRLDLTCEAIIVESKWRPYFGDDLLARSERLLRQSSYAFKPFNGSGGAPSQQDLPQPMSTAGNTPLADGNPTRTDADIEADLRELDSSVLEETTRTALIDARLGQGRFRKELLRIWDGACAVTGCRVEAILHASHCKPWRASDNAERLDPNNGLLLVANLDALFDAGLITFGDDGSMQVASRVPSKERQTLGLCGGLARTPGPVSPSTLHTTESTSSCSSLEHLLSGFTHEVETEKSEGTCQHSLWRRGPFPLPFQLLHHRVLPGM